MRGDEAKRRRGDAERTDAVTRTRVCSCSLPTAYCVTEYAVYDF